MINHLLIHHLVAEQDTVSPLLFKPVQFGILQKLDQGQPLTKNEQRYVRGTVGKKLKVLEGLLATKSLEGEFAVFLNALKSYYITGLEALKHNGYGWFYEPKVIEVINTQIAGKISFRDKTVKCIRVKSLAHRKIIFDAESSLWYASNDQVFKDVAITKNKYTQMIWMQMYQRYRKLFSTLRLPFLKERIDFTRYGV